MYVLPMLHTNFQHPRSTMSDSSLLYYTVRAVRHLLRASVTTATEACEVCTHFSHTDQVEVLASFTEEEALHSVLLGLFDDIMYCCVATPTSTCAQHTETQINVCSLQNYVMYMYMYMCTGMALQYINYTAYKVA